ncbi:Cupin domain-containing protein [Algoriphagus locisalis]|uniref:Cupin domain-containing protein n=1 Tax=Algoriphagus locisalis TaxID=305507 RepID=A0A1I7BDN3_9BACT|nr:cupin domain-containing protein [Algoriphagus locisalis]SFT85336.1 Cupin domain-containing protein [Algoriphagus locisalis]
MSHSTFAQLQPIKSGVYHWDEFEVKESEGRISRPIFEGTSTHFSYLEMHATTQAVGSAASTAHANDDIEELVIVKEGKMAVNINGENTILGPNGVLSLMPKQMHSLKNVGEIPLTYYVIRFRSKKPMNIERGTASGGTLLVNSDSTVYKATSVGGVRSYFDRSTSMCERLEMHVTTLDRKVASHAPHTHVETEIILMISGETAQLIDGKEYRATAGDFYLMESGSLHGIRNTSDEPTTYFAFKWK